MNSWISTVSAFTVILLASGAIASLQLPRLRQLTSATEALSQEDIEPQIEQERLRLDLWQQLPTVGLSNLMADWAFLAFLQYFGDDEAREKTDYALSPEYFEVILNNDPFFWDAYLFLPGSTTMYAAQPQRTIEIMEKHLPKISPKAPDRAYFIWRWKATDELLFLNDVEAAIDSYQTAADWASAYDTEEGELIASISQQTADFLRINPASKAVQVSAWMTIYGNAFDDATRQLAIQNIQALGGKVSLGENGEVIEVQTPQE